MTTEHDDCFKREHDISAAWARAEDELKALRAAALRVYNKYGKGSDWTEWRDLAEALHISSGLK